MSDDKVAKSHKKQRRLVSSYVVALSSLWTGPFYERFGSSKSPPPQTRGSVKRIGSVQEGW